MQGGVIAANEVGKYYYEDYMYTKKQVKLFPRGQIVEYTDLEEFCDR